MRIDRNRRDPDDKSYIVTLIGDGYEIDARLPRAFLDDEVGNGAPDRKVEDFIANNGEEIAKAAISMARASLPSEEAGKLPYFAFVRKPFDRVQFLEIRWDK